MVMVYFPLYQIHLSVLQHKIEDYREQFPYFEEAVIPQVEYLPGKSHFLTRHLNVHFLKYHSHEVVA
jgi:hypothetical protein